VQNASVNPHRDEAYVWKDNVLLAIDLHSGATRALTEVDPKFKTTINNVTADGKYVCSGTTERLAGVDDHWLNRGYIGFRELYEAHPLSQVIRVPVEGGEAEVLHEENEWIGHINTSPTQPHLLTFCHEGPWQLVRQRMWLLDMNGNKVTAVRPQTPDEQVGHEYWLTDGETIGYHGHVGAERHFYGFIRYDNTNHVEADFGYGSHHFHSNTPNLIVGDGPQRGRAGRYIQLWQFDGKTFSEPRVLCEHRCSAHIQILHVHPRLSPDGKQVLFTSDMDGYGQVYLADLPAFESLPKLTEVVGR
jgi:oligogalacturonide lyase